MAKTKQCVSSVLLTLCLTVALCAGFVLAAPVEVKAADIVLRGDFLMKSDNPGDFKMTSSDSIISDGLNSFTIDLLEGDVNISAFNNISILPASGGSISTGGSRSLSISAGGSMTIQGLSFSHGATASLTVKGNPILFENCDFSTGFGDGAIAVDGDATFVNCTFSSANPITNLGSGTVYVNGVLVFGTAPAAPAPAPAPPADADEYTLRHYNYWLPVHARLMRLGNSGNVTVNTDGENLDHIQYFVFDALVGTNRTLTVHHRGETYVIRGAPETEGGMMRTIRLGQNHLFVGNLDNYMI